MTLDEIKDAALKDFQSGVLIATESRYTLEYQERRSRMAAILDMLESTPLHDTVARDALAMEYELIKDYLGSM
jgi:hypothetical protein